MPRTRRRSRERKFVPQGRAYIIATFNNTLITFTDPNGNVVSQSSSGAMGFRGSRKKTAFAAQRAGETAARSAVTHGMRTVDVLVKGPGNGRESAIRAIAGAGIRVSSITDQTPIPHNGCRPPKRRRV
ncbi:MAG: 30S ribosomal protein S11 [Chloroflexi bacterium]|nr:30S ribosomal protein S11 [Chloroflexota bacterium]